MRSFVGLSKMRGSKEIEKVGIEEMLCGFDWVLFFIKRVRVRVRVRVRDNEEIVRERIIVRYGVRESNFG